MGYVKRIACLANSYKAPLGRCIAGKEILANGAAGPWIRPISSRPKGELASAEYSYRAGGRPQILDIIDVPLLRPTGEKPQTENHVIDPNGEWKKAGELDWRDLDRFADHPKTIWINSQSTGEGHNDRMSAGEGASLNGSLLLIKSPEFTVEVLSSRVTGRRGYRGRFFYRERYYNFSLTDPAVPEKFDAQQEGDYRLEDVYLCLSLTRPFEFDGRCYKLVAAMINKREAGKKATSERQLGIPAVARTA